MDATPLSVAPPLPSLFTPTGMFPFAIVSGEGVYLKDDSGRTYLDCYSGHAVSSLGHRHPRILKALCDQAQDLFFISTLADHPKRLFAASRLGHFAKMPAKVFFSNSGAEANEAALRLAYALTKRPKVLAFQRSFHGRTQGVACLSHGVKDTLDQSHAHHVVFCEFGCSQALERTLDETFGAVIVEPIQSVAGVYTAPPEYFSHLRRLCTHFNVPLIFDEVQTGMSRCGAPFYHHHVGVTPDILTSAKGLGAGFPIGATLLRQDWAESISPGTLGSTFGGNPLACAVASEVISVMNETQLWDHVAKMGQYLRAKLASLPIALRGEGLLLGVQTQVRAKVLQEHLVEKGILVGTSSEPYTLRVLPPLVIQTHHLDEFVSAFTSVLGAL